jgi:hypothetical protein
MTIDPERLPTHWRGRAETARSMMDDFGNPEMRRVLAEIAKDYDRIADRIERATLFN